MGGAQFLPYRVERFDREVGMYVASPIIGGSGLVYFSFDDAWEWRPWEECPQLMERCEKCHGTGEVRSRKKGETFRVCPNCLGQRMIPRDDPFTAQN